MKRILAFFLSMMLAATMLVTFAFAEETKEAPAEETVAAETEDTAAEEAPAEETVAAETEDTAAEEAPAGETVAAETEDTAAEETVAAETEDTAAEEAPAESSEETDEMAEEIAGSSSDAASLIPVKEVNLTEEGEVLLEDYSAIEIPSGNVQVSEFEVESYIQSILSSATKTDIITEGVAEDGDQVNIDFSGVVEGEEEPGDGMVAEGYDITLGSGTFIPGFEEQIVGHAIGETFDIDVTFPDEYTEALAGKNAVFTIVLNHKSVSVTPELTDAFVQEFSAANLKETLNTVEELREYTKNYLYKNYLDNAIMNAMIEKETVISYNQSQFEALKAYSAESLAYSVSMYTAYGLEGYNEDSIAQMYGFENAEAYTVDEATYYMDRIMLIDQLCADMGITYTDEEVDAAITQYMAANNMDAEFDLEQFKELTGEGFLLLLTKLNVALPKVMEALEANVVLVEDAPEADVTAAAEETEAAEEVVTEEAAEIDATDTDAQEAEETTAE